MNYQGQGKLIGYHTYTKDNEQKHVYNIINGTLDSKTGLYSECEYLGSICTQQTTFAHTLKYLNKLDVVL